VSLGCIADWCIGEIVPMVLFGEMHQPVKKLCCLSSKAPEQMDRKTERRNQLT